MFSGFNCKMARFDSVGITRCDAVRNGRPLIGGGWEKYRTDSSTSVRGFCLCGSAFVQSRQQKLLGAPWGEPARNSFSPATPRSIVNRYDSSLNSMSRLIRFSSLPVPASYTRMWRLSVGRTKTFPSLTIVGLNSHGRIEALDA